MPTFEPRFQLFGAVGALNAVRPFSEQTHYAGPSATGAWHLGPGVRVKYDSAVLFGVSDASARVALKGIIELEWRF